MTDVARRLPPDHGVVLVEFAVVGLLLFVLLGAVIDFGLGWRKTLDATATLRSGSRVVSSLGDSRTADREALASLSTGIAELGSANVIRVIVYKSTTANGLVPSACLAVAAPTTTASNGGGVTNSCNVYGPAQLADLQAARFTDASGTGCDATDWDRFYCPTSREDDMTIGADYVGMYLEYEINWVIDLLPGEGVVTDDRVVMRIEPSL